MMGTMSDGGRHLSVDEVTAYVDAAVRPEDRPRIEAHLADCDRCRDEVVAVRGTMVAEAESRPGFWRRSSVRVAGLAAAAVLAGFLLFGPEMLTTEDGIRTRGQEAADVAGAGLLATVGPEDGARLAPGSVRFAWRSAGTGAVYELTLTNEIGDIVADTATSDTTLVIPAGGALLEGGVFFWFVDALRDDGSSVSSGARQFEVSSSR